MQAIRTALPDVILLEPKVFGDDRGFFMETFNVQTFQRLTGCAKPFVQDNHSRSTRGVLRGLHYQLGARPQDKLVRAVAGSILDVAVDIRRGSPTFGKWVGEILSAENKRQLWVPVGFAHGFIVLSETAEVLYKVTDYYDPQGERAIRWNDPDIGVDWSYQGEPLLSAKDAVAAAFRDAEVFP
ncbi:dTDP-4-dehydrorhamnose 3,5-epimerase [Solimonas fluminis]|uniref:dTDP-4-dehydrorhamnose 3,5-epimerase n=1 Tax=Solimonas fluminis TaxID=2086571 RepID=A0A2S5TKZ0_9GAMM|nr:dTDP-4-dehydrorhamnose 3,5-epimerase [Solimonas fluminis]PPE75655.1 dTDP-4-dehydrorhamnose 3,5-epimerase [Solimonas fluminis]